VIISELFYVNNPVTNFNQFLLLKIDITIIVIDSARIIKKLERGNRH